MSEAEHLGLLKKDLLMLRNLAIIDIAHASIKAREGKDVPLWTEEILNDKDALKMISEGETYGTFQLESDAMSGCMKNLQPKSFEDVTAGVALYRPGPMQYIPDYIKNKNNPSEIVYDDPRLKPILEPTYGVFVYQEQIMQAVQALAGFTKGEADMVRKAMGKKIDKLMQDLGTKFREQSVENGLSKEKADEIWLKMADFGKYAFNKSHAAAYSCITMQTAYLKCHYPIDFYAGLLTSEMDKKDLLIKHIKDCKDKGVKICPPDVNNSGATFTAGDKQIYYGLTSINKIGQAVAESIVNERELNGKFKSFVDFRKRMADNGSGINTGAIKNLIYAGAFDWTGYSRTTLDKNLSAIDDVLKKSSKIDPQEGQISFFMLENNVESEVLPSVEAACDILENNPRPELDKMSKLSAEKEATGFYVSGHPMESIDSYKGITDNVYVPYANILDITGKKAKTDFSQMSNDEDEDMDDYGLDDDIGATASVFESSESEDLEPKYNDKDLVTVQGIITDMHEIITKKGQQMGFVTIEDAEGNSLKVTVFPQLWMEGGVKQNFKKDDIITTLGEVSSYKGEYGLAAKFIESEDTLKEALYIKYPETKSLTRADVRDTIAETKQEIAITNRTLKRYTPGVLHPIYFWLSDAQRKTLGWNSNCVKITDCNILDDFYPVFQQMYGEANVKLTLRSDIINNNHGTLKERNKVLNNPKEIKNRE